MKDYLGQNLEIGDTVIFVPPDYREFREAEVLRFTPQFVIIQYNNTWNYGPSGFVIAMRQSPRQLIKKPENL